MTNTVIKTTPHGFWGELTYPVNHDLINIFIQKSVEYSEHPAIITEERTISYRELIHQARSLAFYLFNLGVKHETPVGILLEPGIEQIISQVAILMAGGSCVPLDPTVPDDRLCFMLQDLQINLTLTTQKYQSRSLPTNFITINQDILEKSIIVYFPKINREKNHRTHILFTSGTTGRPKAVEIEARGILRIVVEPDYINFTANDKIAAISNPTFDVSLFEIWGALLNGAAAVVIPRKIIIDPYLFEAALEKYSVSCMMMTAALFHLTAHSCPRAFRHLRYLFVGGEKLNPHAFRQVLQAAPPKFLANCYGPTESTIIGLIHEIKLDELTDEDIPIGRPIGHTDIYILNDQLQPVAPNQIGEIYLGGEGIARGYWNRPEINAQRFIMMDIERNNQLKKIYRTGDLGWQRSDGIYMFAGRIDNQIKIRGHRIEIEEIETQLLKSELLQSAAVSIVKKENIEPYLIAFVVPKKPETFSKHNLTQSIKHYLPDYMLPRITIVEHIPINPNGKIDRKRLLAEYTQNQEQRLSSQPTTDTNEDELIVLSIWQKTLDDYDLTLDSNFFQIGGNSLQASSLILALGNKIQKRLPVQLLYDFPTPRTLAAHMSQNENMSEDLYATMLKDSILPPEIQPLPHFPEPWLSSDAGRVLLTGASGFLGAFFLRDLLLQTKINRVTCLVRAKDNQTALLRLKENLYQYGLWQEEFLPRLQVMASDLTKPHLDLSQQDYEQLSSECDAIFHLAAHVNYIQPYSMHYDGNVLGTLNILRLATNKKAKPLHYVSTVSIFGPAGIFSSVDSLGEDDDISPYLTGLKYDSGYSQSKWVAERMIWQARDRGIPLSVYRPGFIMGDSQTGANNPKDFVSRLVKGCIKIGAYPLLANLREEFVPVDYVSQSLLNISIDNKKLGKAYHLVSPDRKQSMDLDPFFALLRQHGYQLEGMHYSEWLKKLETDNEIMDNPLMPLLPMLSEKAYGELSRLEMYKDMPAYDAKNTESALKETPIRYTPMDDNLLECYLTYWKRIGFLS
ncbi:non-ribosomal peptide synthetase [Xenorhabdus innexi]|uniref:Linear gramicidin synthetase subunit B n=1 Tax=Xenorhabdus innexi TaxID=290109 RepID=A0A1N6MZN1_9GAMM|nr:non-ribosomal peptide synthetase [Xenorhabdus innexi]PHM37898.1 linear gramicidin synthetase subunit B [Xenorhabdus innexi]SIP74270.1 putative Nonribosomal peptide synthase (NRPS) [Xenorhabdus innexi]